MEEKSHVDPFSNAIVKETQISENVLIDGKPKVVTQILVPAGPSSHAERFEIHESNSNPNPYMNVDVDFPEQKSIQQ